MRQVFGLLGVKGAGKDTCAAFLVKEAGFVRIGFADALYQEVVDAYGVSLAFLGNRETKEQPLPELALRNCKNLEFVEVALATLTADRSLRRAALAVAAGSAHPAHVSRRRVNALLKAPRSPRWTMQLWGTEYRRQSKFGVDSYWLDRVKAAIDAQPTRSFVVTDVRFLNEAKFILRLGGMLARVRRPELEAREAAERARKGSAAHPSETELLGYPVGAELMNPEGQPNVLREAVMALLQPKVAMAA